MKEDLLFIKQAVLAVADDKWRGGRLYTGIMDDRRFAGKSDTAVEVKTDSLPVVFSAIGPVIFRGLSVLWI